MSRAEAAVLAPLSPAVSPAPQPHRPVPVVDATPEVLSDLPAEWERIAPVTAGPGCIDTVLIGPNGVFAVHIDPDTRPAAARPGRGVLRAGERVPQQVKRALHHTRALRDLLAAVPGDLLPYPILVTPVPGAWRERLGRLLVVRPGRLAEAVWSHPSRPLTRSQRAAVTAALSRR